MNNLIKNLKYSPLTTIDLSSCIPSSPNIRFVKVDLTKEGVETIYNTQLGSSTGYIYAFSNTDGSKYDLNKCNSTTVNIPLSYKLSDNYIQYIKQGIDVYDTNDSFFTDKCNANENLDYDMPLSKRREISQNMTFESINNGQCQYKGINAKTNSVTLNCPYSENGFAYTINETNGYKLDDDFNPIFKCAGKIKKFNKNIALYVYTIIIMLTIGLLIAFAIYHQTELKKMNPYMISALINDELLLREDNFDRVRPTETDVKPTRENTNPNSSNEGNPSIQPKKTVKLWNLYLKNLLELHPVVGLVRPSFITPLLVRIPVFVFNVLVMFGFCAVYYSDRYIENRMENKDRNEFKYPMRHEFPIIIGAICTAMLFTVILKAIILPSFTRKIKLAEEISAKQGTDERNKVLEQFNIELAIRRTIGGIFATALIVFMYYYTVVFCGVYPKTQHGWAISCFWTLFLVWLLFAPFFILVVAIVETLNCSIPLNYYIKKLFWY